MRTNIKNSCGNLSITTNSDGTVTIDNAGIKYYNFYSASDVTEKTWHEFSDILNVGEMCMFSASASAGRLLFNNVLGNTNVLCGSITCTGSGTFLCHFDDNPTFATATNNNKTGYEYVVVIYIQNSTTAKGWITGKIEKTYASSSTNYDFTLGAEN